MGETTTQADVDVRTPAEVERDIDRVLVDAIKASVLHGIDFNRRIRIARVQALRELGAL